MYLSLLKLNPLSHHVRRDLSDVVELHRTIMKAFPEEENDNNARALYKVLHRLEVQQAQGTILLYVQSKHEPDWKDLPSGYVVTNHGPQVHVKLVGHIYEEIPVGRVFQFRLRANPTRKIDTKSGTDGQRRNGRRVPVNGDQSRIEWLARQGLRGGFELLTVAIARSGSAELVRSRSGGRTFQGVLYEGRLLVRDKRNFQNALAEGIGPAKAFGFGLLSVASE